VLSAATAELRSTRVRTGAYETQLLAAGDDGDVLVLLHGGGPGIDAGMNWRPILPQLGTRFRCLAPDMVGFGATDRPDPLPRGPKAWLELRVRQTLALLDELGIEKAHVLGNARGGGAVALRCLIDAPERFERGVVMGAGGYVTLDGPPPPAAAAAVVAFYDNPSVEACEQVILRFSRHPELLDRPVRELAEMRFATAMAPGAEESFRAMWDGDPFSALPTPDELAGVAHPVLLTHGAQDAVVAPQLSLALQQLLPTAHLHVFPDASHWTHLDQPLAFLQLVTAFLTGGLDAPPVAQTEVR
jgi:2-hydroxymuconate-semialdehyde hydrolase